MSKVEIRLSRPLRDPRWRRRSDSIELNQERFESPSAPLAITDLRGNPLAMCRHQALPFADESVDLVVLEEVLELVRDDHSLFGELGRVLKPGGIVRIRVPNAGPLAGCDAFNLYRYVADVTRRGVRIPEVDEVGFRRHYTVDALESALGARFETERTWTTGTAVSELAHFGVLAVTTFVRHAPERYSSARPALRTLKRLDLRVPMAQMGYWRWIEARRLPR